MVTGDDLYVRVFVIMHIVFIMVSFSYFNVSVYSSSETAVIRVTESPLTNIISEARS